VATLAASRPEPLPLWRPAAVAAFGAGWVAFYLATRPHEPTDAAVVLSGMAFLVGGLVVAWQRPAMRFGPLLMLTGLALFAATLEWGHRPVAWTIAQVLNSSFAPLLYYVALSFPRDRLETRLDRALVAGVFVLAVVWPTFAILVFVDPLRIGCTHCPADLNLLLISHQPAFVGASLAALHWAIAAMGVAVTARLGHRWLRATAPRRRVLAPVVVPVVAWTLLHSGTRVLHSFTPQDWNNYGPIVAVSTFMLMVVPFGVLVGLLRARARRARVGDLVVELGQLAGPDRLQDAVARTLGDPSAEVGFWMAESRRYVTVAGEPLVLPQAGSDRDVSYVEGRGEPLAAIVHDAALLDDPRLVDAVGAAARFAVENERLHAELLAKLEEVRASRARIVEAGDTERRRIERNLHDGAQQRLIAVMLQLRMLATGRDRDEARLRSGLDRAAGELGNALDELRDLAHGLHPSVLTDEGFAGALEFLAERSPVPVALDVDDVRRSGTVEATAYYVVAEALANAAKYASAQRVDVRVQGADGRFLVEVTDDGAGGASPASGSGLRGLADRVAAVGGTLTVDSPAGAGTRVRAELPDRGS
jgi:signal transduction histidine kinase